MAAKIDYNKIFANMLRKVPTGERLTSYQIVSASEFDGVSKQTVKKHFKNFLDANPGFLERVTGFYPKAETIVCMVEAELGSIAESNLDRANVRCSEIVRGIARPIVEEFIRTGLSRYLESTNDNLRIGLHVLTDFLIEDFTDFVRSAGNGLVSIAGGLNELLLIKAMENAGLQRGQDFTKTGQNSKADIIVHSSAGTKDNLSVEVKSYHARERLLRGLQDINVPKIGVGFFKDPSEFNPARTETLLQAQPAAIYLPQATLDKLSDESKALKAQEKAAYKSVLYRPLERFVTDMEGFCKNGVLPAYQGKP